MGKSSITKTPFKGESVLIGSSETDGQVVTLSDSIGNYKFLLVHVYRTSSYAAEATGLVPVDIFRLYDSLLHSFGVNAYNDGRVYGYINYVTDTQVKVQVSTGNGIAIYGIK